MHRGNKLETLTSIVAVGQTIAFCRLPTVRCYHRGLNSNVMDVIEPPAAVSRVRPANQLYLIVLLLLLAVGAPLQAWRIWPGEIFTELFVILLPTLLFAPKTGSTADALRLRWRASAEDPGIHPRRKDLALPYYREPGGGVPGRLGSSPSVQPRRWRSAFRKIDPR